MSLPERLKSHRRDKENNGSIGFRDFIRHSFMRKEKINKENRKSWTSSKEIGQPQDFRHVIKGTSGWDPEGFYGIKRNSTLPIIGTAFEESIIVIPELTNDNDFIYKTDDQYIKQKKKHMPKLFKRLFKRTSIVDDHNPSTIDVPSEPPEPMREKNVSKKNKTKYNKKFNKQ